MIYTRKIQLNFHLPSGMDAEEAKTYRKAQWKLLYDMAYQARRAANMVVNYQQLNNTIVRESAEHNLLPESTKKERKDTYKAKSKELMALLGTSIQNTTYQVISNNFPDLPSDIRTSLNQGVCKNFMAESVEVLKGERSLRTYKKGMPLPFSAASMRNWRQTGEAYTFDWFKGLSFDLYFGRDRSNNRAILERGLADWEKIEAEKAATKLSKNIELSHSDADSKAINKKWNTIFKEKIKDLYKISASSIQIKDGKIFLLLCVSIPNRKPILDPDTVVGVNMGLIVPAYVSIPGKKARMAIGSYEDLLLPRLRIQMQRKNLSRSLSYGAKSGKGRRKKMSRLDNLKKRERDYVKTVNHNISKRIIDFALKYNAGVIRLEDLAGFDASEFCLRNWSYFELQNFVKYKAKAVGIEIQFVKPYNHSHICSECRSVGTIQIKNRTFTCRNTDCKNHEKPIHVDYNASLNAALCDEDCPHEKITKSKEVLNA